MPSPSRDVRADSPATSPASGARDLAIDRYRGGLMVLMVAGNYLSGVALVPGLLKHAPDLGLTIADVVAPCFVFAIGLTYRSSFLRRLERGAGAAYRHFLLRYLALIGIGAIISAGGTSVAGQSSDWGVLQAIGVAGLIALPLVRLPTWSRFVIGVLLLVAYQVVLDIWALPAVLGSEHAGFIGAVSWGALLVLATAVADVWRRGLLGYVLCCGAFILVGIAAAFVVPLSKPRVSLSYVLVTVAVSAVAFLVVALASRAVRDRAGIISWWGENPLTLYLLHLLLLAIVVLPTSPGWYLDAPWWLVGAQLLVLLAAISTVAWWMHRGQVRLRL